MRGESGAPVSTIMPPALTCVTETRSSSVTRCPCSSASRSTLTLRRRSGPGCPAMRSPTLLGLGGFGLLPVSPVLLHALRYFPALGCRPDTLTTAGRRTRGGAAARACRGVFQLREGPQDPVHLGAQFQQPCLRAQSREVLQVV